MEALSGSPDTLVIGQDEDTEIHVQPAMQNGTRHLDIRIWRRGPSGFAPTRDALVLDTADLEPLRQGIVELLEASEDGRQVARIVLDTGEGRRLRAETEPFGTRYVAHLGFWQRGRDTWRSDGDGIVLAAERLTPLLDILLRYGPWVEDAPGKESRQVTTEMQRPIQESWPSPGGDWLTIEADCVALHPRGIRITFAVEGQEGDHWLTVRQWRREETLWIPEAVTMALGIVDVDALLTCLRMLLGREEQQTVREEIVCADGSALQLSVDGEGVLAIAQRLPSRAGMANGFEPRLSLPLEYLPRLGRAFAQSWSLLVGWLSERERDQLQGLDHSPQVSPQAPAEGRESASSLPRVVGPAARFGEDSPNPGAVIPQEGQVRVIVEGYLLPRGLTLPADVVARVVTGLENLYALQLSQPRIAPMLMCDRPECAVYGRVGTTTRPNAIELRVWTSPRSSDSITFERIYLPELIEGLRHALRVLGKPEPLPTVSFSSAQRVTHGAAIAAAEGDESVDEARTPNSRPATPRVHLGDLQFGLQSIRLDLEGSQGEQSLSITWDGQELALPMNHVEELLADVRALYYDALRGRRGPTRTVGGASPVDVGIRNQGTTMYLELRSGVDEEGASLSFPAKEIPEFLNVARTALEQPTTSEEG